MTTYNTTNRDILHPLLASLDAITRSQKAFGFIIIIGGLLTPFVGFWAAQHILGWWSSGGSSVVRVFAGVSLALGILIVYAVARERRS